MAQHNSPSQAEPSWLLPSNRKLRNLTAIFIRNVSTTASASSPARKRGATIDDDALPQTLKSPAKLLALREQTALSHSRSSTDLRAVIEDATSDDDSVRAMDVSHGNRVGTEQQAQEGGRGTGNTPARRPQFRKLRRRSTLEWANATPHRRQQRLEDVIRDRAVDVFCSLHVEGLDAPVYISETVSQTMNPTFRNIDWSTCGPGITRQNSISIRVWIKGGKSADWRQLLQLNIALSNLLYLGKSLDSLTRPLPENAVLLQLVDGVYVAPTESDLPPSRSVVGTKKTASNLRPLPTSSFDALLRLSKLDDSIQDALATRDQIANDLEALLLSNREALVSRDAVAEARDRVKTIDYAKKTVEKQLEKARKQKQEKQASLETRRELMESDAALRGRTDETIRETRPSFETSREELHVKRSAMQNQRRRICEDLQQIYPIEQRSGKVLSFSIGGLHLPTSEQLDSEPPEVVAAALGYVAHTLQLLSFYLAYPLPYPVTPRGSTSSIYDSISILQTKNAITNDKAEEKLRTYPLFSKSMPRFRFEYAVFLLNQNIRILLESAFGLRVLDIRQTLPNLKYLLYVATAGDGELPARKAGGVRGLMRAPAMQRVNSADSTSSGLSGLTLFSNGKGKQHSGAVDRLREIRAKAA